MVETHGRRRVGPGTLPAVNVVEFDLSAMLPALHSDEGPPFGSEGYVALDGGSSTFDRERVLRWN